MRPPGRRAEGRGASDGEEPFSRLPFSVPRPSPLAPRLCWRVAPAQSCFGEPAQIVRRCFAVRYDFLRVFVTQFLERKIATFGNPHRFVKKRLGINALQDFVTAQMPFAARMQRAAGLGHWHAEPDCGEYILQRTASAHMHVHVAARHARQTAASPHVLQCCEPIPVAAACQQFDRDPGAPRKTAGEPGRVIGLGLRRREPERKTVFQSRADIFSRQAIAALFRVSSAAGDQLGKIAVAFPVLGEQDKAQAVIEPELGADDQFQSGVFCGYMRAHDTGERALVGDCQRFVTAPDRGFDQFLRVRSAPQKGEIGEAVQFGVRGVHSCRKEKLPSGLKRKWGIK